MILDDKTVFETPRGRVSIIAAPYYLLKILFRYEQKFEIHRNVLMFSPDTLNDMQILMK